MRLWLLPGGPNLCPLFKVMCQSFTMHIHHIGINEVRTSTGAYFRQTFAPGRHPDRLFLQVQLRFESSHNFSFMLSLPKPN